MWESSAKTTFGNILNLGALPNVKTCSNFSTQIEYFKSPKADHLIRPKNRRYLPTKGKKIPPKKPNTFPYGKESFSKTEDPGISWMLNSALECVVQIHLHLMQMKQMKRKQSSSLSPYNVESTFNNHFSSHNNQQSFSIPSTPQLGSSSTLLDVFRLLS
jgi:hypothetical protein